MDKRVLRERMRKKQQQIRRRQMMKKGAYVVAVILDRIHSWNMIR